MQAVLPPSSYLDACSFLVEETLSSILNDILSLPDIPEAESHRLNALCQRLDRLKELFVLAPGEVRS
jgi:centromere/kinetochore protein ZW10